MCCVLVYMHVFFSICFTQMSMFSFHILFLYLLLQKIEYFCLFYALASMIFYSGSCIVCNVFISDIFEMFYAFLCILCILIQGTMVEQLCLNGFSLYKYICNKNKNGWVNNGDAGDLRRHRVHYDVIVMLHWNGDIILTKLSSLGNAIVNFSQMRTYRFRCRIWLILPRLRRKLHICSDHPIELSDPWLITKSINSGNYCIHNKWITDTINLLWRRHMAT